MKIMEYNLQSGKNYEEKRERNYDFSLNVIKAEAPDIVGLCEVGKQPSGVFGAYPLECEVDKYLGEALGMYSYYGISTYFDGFGYGNALLSKHPIKSAKTVIIPDVPTEERIPGRYYETRSILAAELDVPGGLTVLVSHFGLVDAERKNAIDTLMPLISEAKGTVIFMGDLNIGHNDPLLSPVYEKLNEAGRDLGELLLTFPSDEPKQKIDYIFVSKELKILSQKTIRTRASDHVPYVVEIDF